MPSSVARLRRDSRGISVVEILIVVSCIAILLAILCALLTYVRQAGYRTRCASNMLQLASAFQTYQQDWSDYWPCPGGLMGDYAYWHQTGNGGLMQYVRQRDHHSVWCCPLMPDWKGRYDPRSYSMNSYLREPADVEYPTCVGITRGIRTSNISQMNRTVLLFEGLPLIPVWKDLPPCDTRTFYVYIYRCCNWSGVKGYYPSLAYTIDPSHPWHGTKSNYIYADGHLCTRRPGRKTVGTLSTYKEMREWYVDKGKFEAITWPKNRLAGAPYE